MKKFSKILILLLSLVVIVSAFAVAAFAAEETTLSESHTYTNVDPNYGGSWAKPYATGTSGTRSGYIYTEASADGNLYAVYTPSPYKGAYTPAGAKVTTDTWYHSPYLDQTLITKTYDLGTDSDGDGVNDTVDRKVYEYNPKDYPYMVYDFDIMTPTGSFGDSLFHSMAFRTYVFNESTGKMTDTKTTHLTVYTSGLLNKLDKTPYNWQHVTMVCHYADSNIDPATGLTVGVAYDIDVYIDGAFATNLSNSNSATSSAGKVAVGIRPEYIGIFQVRSSAAASSGTALVDFEGYDSNDPTTWPDADPSQWYKEKVAVDNQAFTYYKSDWSSNAIAADRFAAAATPTDTAKAGASLTSDGVTTYYATFEEAYAAAKDGDTVALYYDLEEPVEINKAITVDVGIRYGTHRKTTYKYNEDGTPVTNEKGAYVVDKNFDATYLLGVYNFAAISRPGGYVATPVAENEGYVVNNDEAGNPYVGKYSFAQTEDYYTVNWDPECDGDCDCYEGVGHILAETTIAGAGYAPICPVIAPEFDIVDGLEITFMGWSTEKGGEPIDITEITAATGETVNLYPVYEFVQYGIEVITSEGVSTYYLASEAADVFFGGISSGSTVKLHQDIVVTEMFTMSSKKNMTLDLNGYAFHNLTTKITQYEATLGDDGEYVKGAALGDAVTTGSGGYVFYISVKPTFTITSSRPGATFSALTVTASQWVCDGEVVNTEVSSAVGKTIFNAYPSAGTFNILGENITFYTGSLIYAEHGSSACVMNIDGGTFHTVGSPAESMLAIRNGNIQTIKNATFYCNGALLQKNSSGAGNRNKDTNFIFENCDIYDASIYNNAPTDHLVFINCRLAGLSVNGGTAATILLCENTVMTSDLTQVIKDSTTSPRLPVEAADSAIDLELDSGLNLNLNIELVSISKTDYYDKTTATQLTFDPETLVLNGAQRNVVSANYVYMVRATDSDLATVTWKDNNGNVIMVTEEDKNTQAFAPKVAWGDSYRGVVNAIWTDAEGVVSDLYLGDADSYEFTATLPSEEDAWFVAHLNDAMFNITYYAHFAYNFYVPVVEGVSVTSIGGKAPKGSVLIYGKEYYVYTTYSGTVNALSNASVGVIYTVDGVEYRVTFNINALLYAQLSMFDPMSTETEKEALACLVRYIHESYKVVDADHVLDDATEAKFQDFYTNYRTPADYVTEYPAGELKTPNYDAIDGLVEEVHFTVIYDKVSFAVVLTDEAVAAGYKVFFSGVGYGNEYNVSGKTYYTDNRVLYRYLMAPNYTVTIVDKDNNTVVRDLDGDGVAETKAVIPYSMATYITEMENEGVNVDFVKALYAFGKATIAVREQIY